jgi:hypothetical protein
MTGKSVLEPSETTTNNENGGESLENSRRDFDGPFISKVSKISFFSVSLLRKNMPVTQ